MHLSVELVNAAVANANAGATFNIAGISLEQKFPTRTYVALEGDLLSSRVDRQDGVFEIDFDTFGAQPSLSTLRERFDFTEATLTASLHQLLGRDWELGAVYRFSRASLKDSFPQVSPDVAAGSGFTASYYLRGVLQSVDLTQRLQISRIRVDAKARQVGNRILNWRVAPKPAGIACDLADLALH